MKRKLSLKIATFIKIMHKMFTLLNVVYVNNYVKKRDVNVQKSHLFVKILFVMLLIINPMMHLLWVFNHLKTILFAINNNVHYFKFSFFAPFKYHYQQMNSTQQTKRLRYSLTSNNRLNSSQSINPLVIKPQSTILAEKYLFLLQIIRDMRYDIRRSYAGSRTSMENLRKKIIKARTIVLQCKDLCSRREYDHCQILMQCQSIEYEKEQQ
jgi:hypothetical protein